MSRRAITKAVRSLRKEIVNDIEIILSRELARLEPAEPANSQGPAPSAATGSDQQTGVLVSQKAGQQIYSLIETTEDLIALERQGKRRAFAQKSVEAEELITRLDNELLSQVNLTAEQPKN